MGDRLSEIEQAIRDLAREDCRLCRDGRATVDDGLYSETLWHRSRTTGELIACRSGQLQVRTGVRATPVEKITR